MNLVKNIKEIAKKVLINEAEALRRVSELINDEFIKTVEVILQSKGRLIVCGIGKSAIIANKITATLNSTGTPSIYMHAADAIHGDLGMIKEEDMIMILSKSGNTPEIKVLIPLLKRMEVPIIGMVSNLQSELALQADYVIDATIEEEACPHNLAPTTSTTVHLALGDTLAVCLLESRGFSSDDFAKFHPGGSLGKKLYLKVSDVYPNNQCPTVTVEATIPEVILEITSKRLGATAVLDEQENLMGIITDGDLRRMLKEHKTTDLIGATDIMSTNPQTIEPDAYAVSALGIMQQRNITQLIVAQGKQVLGFVHLHDLLKEGIL
ncbi:MAG: KpsF/GutQ family sugar-phosphate isomerase [Cyclobacteriaceae bacterium]|nr:KpsF/GutQ family sugar-phosphate isomerase [Cyclobacteriaceae bacterium]